MKNSLITNILKKLKSTKPYIPTQTSWKDGLVVFRNTPFNEALKVLSKRFNVEFIVKNDKLYNNSFTGPFDGQHLQLILEHFRLASGIQYRFIDPQTGQEGNIKEKRSLNYIKCNLIYQIS